MRTPASPPAGSESSTRVVANTRTTGSHGDGAADGESSTPLNGERSIARDELGAAPPYSSSTVTPTNAADEPWLLAGAQLTSTSADCPAACSCRPVSDRRPCVACDHPLPNTTRVCTELQPRPVTAGSPIRPLPPLPSLPPLPPLPSLPSLPHVALTSTTAVQVGATHADCADRPPTDVVPGAPTDSDHEALAEARPEEDCWFPQSTSRPAPAANTGPDSVA
mmetsp:Transcript_3772/g.11902  ORF Transcript_3772/g.11902 Transcript_3772/m.11902 type:complete len:222 (-) Transcript_3772:186-851(-)